MHFFNLYRSIQCIVAFLPSNVEPWIDCTFSLLSLFAAVQKEVSFSTPTPTEVKKLHETITRNAYIYGGCPIFLFPRLGPWAALARHLRVLARAQWRRNSFSLTSVCEVCAWIARKLF